MGNDGYGKWRTQMPTKELTHNPNLFDNSHFIVVDKPVFINKAKILEIIGGLKSEDSLTSLKNSVFCLEINLQNIKNDEVGVMNVDSNGGTITISQKYIFDQLNQIAESQTIDRAKYYVDRFEKAINEVRTSQINDINLNRWQEYEDIKTDSLWIMDRRDSAGVHTAGYWGNFIPQIPNQMLKRYTKRGCFLLGGVVLIYTLQNHTI